MDGPAPAFRSTTDAVALKAMAMQGHFRGAVVDGPLTPDSALSAEAARAKGVTSDVAGRVDVLIGPSMESALMVLRTLLALGGGLCAGIVLGARIPVVAPDAQRLDRGAHGLLRARLAGRGMGAGGGSGPGRRCRGFGRRPRRRARRRLAPGRAARPCPTAGTTRRNASATAAARSP